VPGRDFWKISSRFSGKMNYSSNPLRHAKDADDIRKKILSIHYADWERPGFSKGALYPMMKNAEGSTIRAE